MIAFCLCPRHGARYPASMRVLVISLFSAGCVHPQPAPPLPAPSCPPVVVPAAPASPSPVLHDLRWQLAVGREPAHAVPDDLHAFTVARWECALGKVQMDDAREASGLRLTRTRRLACTHASGSTIQTSLACEVITGAPASARSLPLALDTAPLLTLGCTPVAVERVASVLGTLCATPAGVTYCTGP
ncbi:MAG TPA: hypothetical protein VFX59_01320 [Polyangiales bacterium]|nr:hypothetical protein [Polyangiales bacterium]